MTATSVIGRRALATGAGLAASAAVPALSDRLHPVARFGQLMEAHEGRWYRDDRGAGVAYATSGVLLGAATGRVLGTAPTVAVAAAGRQLRQVAADIGALLAAGELDAARSALPRLAGRDPSTLDASGVAAAVIESVAENMVDAVFAPAWWGVIAGGAGAGAHRAANTMDAMVGRRDERYRRYGWASARLDDALAHTPARLFVLALMVGSPGRARRIVEVVRRDAPAHPSPNAGVAEAAMAGALGCCLGGPLVYGDVPENRPQLGDGPRPGIDHLDGCLRLAVRAERTLIAALTAGGLMLLGRRS